MRLVSLTLFACLTIASVVAGHSAFVPTETTPVGADTLPDDSVANRQTADSVRQQAVAQITKTKADTAAHKLVKTPRLPQMPNDTLNGTNRKAAADTTPVNNDKVKAEANDSTTADTVKTKKPGIDSPVEYVAKDSMVYDADSKLAYLYGESKVTYLNMNLDAEKITMNMDSSMVYAEGRQDSTVKGGIKGKPVYTQGSERYDSERMSFNFKTKKGFISNVATTQGNGFLQSEKSKRADDGTLYLEHAKYTTCDAEHPHFYLKLSVSKGTSRQRSLFRSGLSRSRRCPPAFGRSLRIFPL